MQTQPPTASVMDEMDVSGSGMPEGVDVHYGLDDLAAAASLPMFDTIQVSSLPEKAASVPAMDPVRQDDQSPQQASSHHHHLFATQQVPSPSQRSQASTIRSEAVAQNQSQTGDVDTGFLQVFGPENLHDAEKQAMQACLEQRPGFPSPQQQDLQESFIDTYWEYCYTWCPVLDRETLPDEMARSPLLSNALATAASHIQPPLLPHEGPAEFYKKAKALFYDDEELDGLTSLKAIALFYWWAPRPPTLVHRHSSWWWTSVIIRHAQQMNIHREPSPSQTALSSHDLSLRRKIWWTAFVSYTAIFIHRPTCNYLPGPDAMLTR
jgi:transcription factor-like protein